jgi:hypothetical protein
MLVFQINGLELIVIAVINFFLSWLWYSPVLFAKPWMKALKWPADRVMTDADKKAMPGLFIGGLVASFALSFVLQVICHSVGAADFFTGLLVGVLAWFGFALTHSLNTLWEGRSPVVLTINNGLFLLTYAVFGGIIGVWH